jgi:hypothetical protein
MKVRVEIDCTPDEARQFFGLPDVKPMQASLMAKMEAQMLEAAERFSPDSMLRTWMSLAPQGAENLRDMFERFFKTAAPTPPAPPRSG